MGLDKFRIQEYIRWYKVSRDVLPRLIPLLKDEEIEQNISLQDWLIFPLPTEAERSQAVNRPDPHIDITLRDPGKIRIGIRCNTLRSVEKLRNILDGYHQKEKAQLAGLMKALDDRFVTIVLSKQKEYNFAQAPKHETLFHERSNTIDEAKITEMFSLVDEIRQRGIEKKGESSVHFLPEAPVLDLVCVYLPLDEEIFRQALEMIGQIFEICIRIKTRSEISRERKRAETAVAKVRFEGFICHRCQMKFPIDSKPMFCPNCGTYISQRY